MTECNTTPIQFSRANRPQVTADFDGGRLTTDAGVLLLREVDRRIGLIDAINDCLPDPRDPRYTTHMQREMLAQRIFSIALGYEDVNDQQTLRDDPALQVAAGKAAEEELPLASPSTLIGGRSRGWTHVSTAGNRHVSCGRKSMPKAASNDEAEAVLGICRLLRKRAVRDPRRHTALSCIIRSSQAKYADAP